MILVVELELGSVHLMYNYVIMTERKEIKDEKRPSSFITQYLLIGLSN